tara:strand:- start:343 stop:591 length:249 start_codon:yes stop_codon:yes gene_type:complete
MIREQKSCVTVRVKVRARVRVRVRVGVGVRARVRVRVIGYYELVRANEEELALREIGTHITRMKGHVAHHQRQGSLVQVRTG